MLLRQCHPGHKYNVRRETNLDTVNENSVQGGLPACMSISALTECRSGAQEANVGQEVRVVAVLLVFNIVSKAVDILPLLAGDGHTGINCQFIVWIPEETKQPRKRKDGGEATWLAGNLACN